MQVLKEKLEDLSQTGISTIIISRLENMITKEPSPKLVWMSPFRLARDWNTDPFETLDAFLFGTRIGIFDLEWDIKCPSCKGSTFSAESLYKLKPVSHCPYCRIDISGGFDDVVEVSFRVNENIRSLGKIYPYEIISHSLKSVEEHPFHAEPGETVTKPLTLRRGTYHMHNDACTLGAPLLIREESQNETIDIRFVYDGEQVLRGTEFYGPGKFNISLVNESDYPLDLKFALAEEYPWVSGAVVATSQIFRDLFSSELIDSDENFSVKNMSFVFTDIKGSTAMYERLGDSQAYYLVKEHFKIMREVVKRYHGSIVKTIGDAIMATFLISTDAMRAIFDMYESFARFNYDNQERDDIIIKVGLHRGPCLAVSSNDRLDYFGRTVNISARVQGLSQGGDMVISETVHNEPGIKDIIKDSRWSFELKKAYLKGIDDLYNVVYLYPPEEVSENI